MENLFLFRRKYVLLYAHRRMKLFNAVNLIQNTVLNELSNSEKKMKKSVDKS